MAGMAGAESGLAAPPCMAGATRARAPANPPLHPPSGVSLAGRRRGLYAHSVRWRAPMSHADSKAWPRWGRALGGRAGCRSVCQTNSSLLSECVTTRSGWPGTSRILFTCRAAAHAAYSRHAARVVSRPAKNMSDPSSVGQAGRGSRARLAGVQDRFEDLDVRRGIGVREVQDGLRRRHAPLPRHTGPREARLRRRKRISRTHVAQASEH